ncbi:hypothetical protein [Paenisporosarcina antarctica]|uniref:Uncharacterized protein n=1 Tax=Paenisporosarcina antarctica TaxID=417367 RepID=A0A4P6ZZ93_9BACL|nr:hypothetical protein [Paenisporosarcina antarctica]QBP41767.1 hypothetical protein E2636_11685 [Paenisporosarcina antarctica]
MKESKRYKKSLSIKTKSITVSILIIAFVLVMGWPQFVPISEEQVNEKKHEVDELNTLTYSVAEGTLNEIATQTTTIYDIKDVIKTFSITNINKIIGEVSVTERQFPNGDSLLFVDFQSPKNDNVFSVNIGKSSAILKEEMINTPIKELYSFRKNRKNTDPLSTRLTYIETKEISLLMGAQVMYKNLTHTYEENDETSTVYQFLEESHNYNMTKDGLEIHVQANKSSASTWAMLSEVSLFSKEELTNAHKIGVDEFRWITPNATLSHGLASIFPAHPDAFVHSLVRQSGRSSALELGKESSRFFENMNRHQFKSLEDSRSKDGLWYSNYTSTWLEKKYNIGSNYVDSRHNDNIFRSQLRRAEILGYENYAQNIEVYANFLLKMVEEGYTIPTDHGLYLIDYFDLNNKMLTHVSLNHALSLMNYLYFAYIETGNVSYLSTANLQLAALIDTGDAWINDDANEVNYQLNRNGTFSGRDYNLVTYYDLLYTKQLLQQLGKQKVPIVDKLILVKKNNLLQRNIEYEINNENIEDLIGLIE